MTKETLKLECREKNDAVNIALIYKLIEYLGEETWFNLKNISSHVFLGYLFSCAILLIIS